jgi:threonine/homoserine/homoserine lactone efflux protein
MVSTVEYPAMKKTPQTSNKRRLAVIAGLIAMVVNPPITLFFLTWGFALYGLTFSLLKNMLLLIKKIRRQHPENTTPVK